MVSNQFWSLGGPFVISVPNRFFSGALEVVSQSRGIPVPWLNRLSDGLQSTAHRPLTKVICSGGDRAEEENSAPSWNKVTKPFCPVPAGACTSARVPQAPWKKYAYFQQ